MVGRAILGEPQFVKLGGVARKTLPKIEHPLQVLSEDFSRVVIFRGLFSHAKQLPAPCIYWPKEIFNFFLR